MFPSASKNCQKTKLQIHPNNHKILRKCSQKCDTWALKSPRRCLEEPSARRSSLFVASSQLSPHWSIDFKQPQHNPKRVFFFKIGELIVW